jgi:hypothetical protein
VDSFTFLYIDDVHTSQEAQASTACYEDSFTFLYIDDVHTSQETHMSRHSLLLGELYLLFTYLATYGRAPRTVVRVKTRRAACENLFEAMDREGDVTPLLAITGEDTTEGGGIFSRSCSRSFSIILATITDGEVWDGPDTKQQVY